MSAADRSPHGAQRNAGPPPPDVAPAHPGYGAGARGQVTAGQIGAIHAIAKRLRLDDDTRRAVIARETGKNSSRELTGAEAARVIDALKASLPPAARRAELSLDGAVAAKLRALWISGWNLGVVRARDDAALIAFVERQTGLSHPRFLREPADARKAIEALKAMLAREAGVRWPPRHSPIVDVKRAVIATQLQRLVGLRVTVEALDVPAGLNQDQVMIELGRRLRRALLRQDGREPPGAPADRSPHGAQRNAGDQSEARDA
jgi:Protein of unknown function (DUF1018)